MKAVIMRVICFTATWHIPQNNTTIEIKGTVLWQARSFCLECQLRVLNHYVTEKKFVNDKITASYQTNMSSQYYFTRYKQQKWTLKNCWRNMFSKTTIAILFNLHQVCPSVPTFVFAVLFIPSFNVLSSFLYFAQLGGSLHCPNSGRIRDTQLL